MYFFSFSPNFNKTTVNYLFETLIFRRKVRTEETSSITFQKLERRKPKVNVFGDLRKLILTRTMENSKSQSCWNSPTCSGVGGPMYLLGIGFSNSFPITRWLSPLLNPKGKVEIYSPKNKIQSLGSMGYQLRVELPDNRVHEHMHVGLWDPWPPLLASRMLAQGHPRSRRDLEKAVLGKLD